MELSFQDSKCDTCDGPFEDIEEIHYEPNHGILWATCQDRLLHIRRARSNNEISLAQFVSS